MPSPTLHFNTNPENKLYFFLNMLIINNSVCMQFHWFSQICYVYMVIYEQVINIVSCVNAGILTDDTSCPSISLST